MAEAVNQTNKSFNDLTNKTSERLEAQDTKIVEIDNKTSERLEAQDTKIVEIETRLDALEEELSAD